MEKNRAITSSSLLVFILLVSRNQRIFNCGNMNYHNWIFGSDDDMTPPSKACVRTTEHKPGREVDFALEQILEAFLLPKRSEETKRAYGRDIRPSLGQK